MFNHRQEVIEMLTGREIIILFITELELLALHKFHLILKKIFWGCCQIVR